MKHFCDKMFGNCKCVAVSVAYVLLYDQSMILIRAIFLRWYTSKPRHRLKFSSWLASRLLKVQLPQYKMFCLVRFYE